MILLDFQCPSGHRQEEFVPSSQQQSVCDSCGLIAQRIISGTSFQLDGTDPGFPTAWDRWAKQHEKAGGQTDD